jgi:hypothetical protein
MHQGGRYSLPEETLAQHTSLTKLGSLGSLAVLVEGQRSDRAVVVQIKSPEASILFPELNANLNFSGPDLA